MGHLAIVVKSTLELIDKDRPYISYRGTLRDDIYKTIADLFADALTVREDDKIFTWCVNETGAKGNGFDRYYIADGNVLFMPEEEFPIKVGIKELYKYDNAVSEVTALDLFREKILWNAIGKKSLGRGRSLSHQTIDEDAILIDLLNEANKDSGPSRIVYAPIDYSGSKVIEISNFSFTESNPPTMGRRIDDGGGKYHIPLNSVPIETIIWNKGNHFLCEKALEAYLCSNIDKNVVNFCKIIGHPRFTVKWLGNYLPFGVQGSSMDMVVEIEQGPKRKVILLELKDDTFGYSAYKQDVDSQILPYQDFVKKAFKKNRGGKITVESVFLSHSPHRTPNPEEKPIYKGVKWIGYNIDNPSGTVSFTRIL